ncbi:MAG: TadG family pilus assembly protein [Sphingobium sp.]
MIRPRRPVRLRLLGRDRRGGVTIILAGAMMMLAGAATVAVDLGSVYLAKRQLQGIADAAVLAASRGGRSAAQALITRAGVTGVSLRTMDEGYYAADPAVPVDARFVSGDPRATAVRLDLERRVPLFFGRLLVGRDGMTVHARATAARTDSTAFSIGTGLASIEDGLPNMLLSALAGTQLNLSVMDTQGLANLDVDLLGFADALRVRLGKDGEAYGQLFDRRVPVADLLAAMADSSAGPATATLRTVGGRLGSRSARLSDIIDLGPMRGAASATGEPALIFDALSMLRMILSPPAGTAVPMDLRLSVPGLTDTRLMLITGPGETATPMVTVTATHDVAVRTAQTRIYLESSVATALSGLLKLRVPLYIELASAEARLSAIDCAARSPGRGVTLAVTPSVGTAALADIDTGALTDFSAPANLRPALLGQTIALRVTGYANIPLGGVTAQTVHFTPEDIDVQRSKRVSTGDLTQGVAVGVISRTKVQVSLLGLGLGLDLGALTPAIAGVLTTVAPLLDTVLNSVTGLLGVRVGSADVRVHALRCGKPTIVA